MADKRISDIMGEVVCSVMISETFDSAKEKASNAEKTNGGLYAVSMDCDNNTAIIQLYAQKTAMLLNIIGIEKRKILNTAEEKFISHAIAKAIKLATDNEYDEAEKILNEINEIGGNYDISIKHEPDEKSYMNYCIQKFNVELHSKITDTIICRLEFAGQHMGHDMMQLLG